MDDPPPPHQKTLVSQPIKSAPEPEYDEPDPATFIWPKQSIPHHVMVAGLLAAAMIRPVKPFVPEELVSFTAVGEPHTADPWASGVAQLQQMEALTGFSPMQWASVQRGCLSLLSGWGVKMRRLSWTTENAFGVDPEVPAAAVHAYGLGVLLGDGRMVEMTEKGARIETWGGVSQALTCRPNIWAVPIWTAEKHG